MMGNPKKKKTAANVPEQTVEHADYSSNPIIALRVPGDCGGQRLDQVLARLLSQHSRSRLQRWIREGRVTVNAELVVEPRHALWGDETIKVAEAPDEVAESATPEDIPLLLVYEDDSLMVIDKPAGLVVHPGSGNWHGTLLNALLHHTPSLDRIPRAGIVHRLDKDTSGLMVVAKTLEAQTDLVRQMQARTVKRHYHALARGLVEKSGSVDAPIGRHPTQRTRMAVLRTGKPARTHYRPLERFLACTLIECALETGRTHQIRVHLTSVGHPLVGDPAYGGGASRVPRGPAFSRQALHASRLALTHPQTGRAMFWKSTLPDDMTALIATLRNDALLLDETAEDDDDQNWASDPEGGPDVIYIHDDDCDDADDDEDLDDQ